MKPSSVWIGLIFTVFSTKKTNQTNRFGLVRLIGLSMNEVVSTT